MRTIVIPTDFSDISTNATTFGVQLAVQLKADVLFYHAYNFPHTDPFSVVFQTMGNAVQTADLERQYKMAIEKQLSDMCSQYKKQFGLTCDSFSAAGMRVEQVIDTLELVEGSFVVMGTKGHADRKELLMGSNAARMVAHAPVPVMVIPAGASYKPITSILFASSLLEKDIDPLQLLLPIAEAHNADLHLVHIDKQADSADEHDAMEGYKEIVQDNMTYNKLHFHLMKEEDVIEGINKAADAYSAQLIVMNTLRKDGVAGWFKRSLSKQMVFHTDLPLLVFQS